MSRCAWCAKPIVGEVHEHRVVAPAPDRGGRTKLFVSRFHPSCNEARLRDFAESQARSAVRAEADRAELLAAVRAAQLAVVPSE